MLDNCAQNTGTGLSVAGFETTPPLPLGGVRTILLFLRHSHDVHGLQGVVVLLCIIDARHTEVVIDQVGVGLGVVNQEVL